MGKLDQKILKLYPSEEGKLPSELILEPPPLSEMTETRCRMLQRRSKFDRKMRTYGINLVDDDFTDIDKRTIQTVSIDRPSFGFGDENLIEKLNDLVEKKQESKKKSSDVFVLQSSSNIRSPLDYELLTAGLDYLFPTGRGHFKELGRNHDMSLDEYIKHLILQHHAGFRSGFVLQFLYNFLVRNKFWKKISLQCRIKINDVPCVKLYNNIPIADIEKMISFYQEKQRCRLLRLNMPEHPKGLDPITLHFMRNVKYVNSILPHSNESALNQRNCYNAMMIRSGTPLFWVTANPNCVENPIVLHMITGEVLKFPDLTATEKSNLIGQNPGSTAVYFREFLRNVIQFWLGFDPDTLVPTKIGGILPRIKEFAIAVECDGAQSLHCHILCWGFVKGSLQHSFEYFSKCKRHREIFKHLNPCWKYGFWNKTSMEEVVILLNEQKKKSVVKSENKPIMIQKPKQSVLIHSSQDSSPLSSQPISTQSNLLKKEEKIISPIMQDVQGLADKKTEENQRKKEMMENIEDIFRKRITEIPLIKLTGIPPQHPYRIPKEGDEKILFPDSCKDCVRSIDCVGNSFIRMINLNFTSELPFDDDINNIILKCTYCKGGKNTLILKSERYFHQKLRKRGPAQEHAYLYCKQCKHSFTSTEKILEGINAQCKKLKMPEFNPTRQSKRHFIFNGLDTTKYVENLNDAFSRNDIAKTKHWVSKLNLEIAQAMYYLNIHHWKHFNSCFKYTKKNQAEKQNCRYKKPDWPILAKNFLTFEIDENGFADSLKFSRQQRATYIYFSESVINLMKSDFCNHCVKLVKTPQLGFYWASYSTKTAKDNAESINYMYKNLKHNLINEKKNIKKKKAEDSLDYKKGMSFFSRAAHKFNQRTVVSAPMAAFCVINGKRFIFNGNFFPRGLV